MKEQQKFAAFPPVPAQAGKLALVTGTGGLGLETAKALVAAGAHVILAGRNREKGQEAVATIRALTPEGQVEFEEMDLADLESVAGFAKRMVARGQAVDLLINNAGIMSPPKRRTTRDGFEVQFGVNHLGHFALTAQLLPLLRAAKAARVVHVTSLAHHFAKLDFDDLQNERHYKPGVAYSQSKLAVALFARELQKRSEAAGWGIASLAAHPGYASTNLIAAEQGSKGFMSLLGAYLVGPLLGQSAAAGALPTLMAATSPDAVGGELYGPTGFMSMKGAPGRCAYHKNALDDDAARRLWEVSEQLTGLSFD